MAEYVNINVDGVEVEAEKGATVLEAVTATNYTLYGLDVPTLSYLKDVKETDDSGVCIVGIEGEPEPVNASEYRVYDGMKVTTHSPEVMEKRTKALQAISDIHDRDCTACVRQAECEFRDFFSYPIHTGKLDEQKRVPIDDSSIIVRDNNRCIRCGRCVAVCRNVQGIGAIEMDGEGLSATVAPVSPEGLSATNCVNCGQCIAACPVGALYERDDTEGVFAAIRDPEKFTVVQIAPAVRAALGEEFRFPAGTDVERRIPSVLRELGFDKVFDTKFGADLTIMEESNELLERIANGGTLPMMTSCCPGWIKYCEHFYPELLPNLSSCKAPHTMFGATVKSYYAKEMGISKENIVVVSIMPCTAKKFEITRDDECGAGVPDVDYSLTTRELARMIKKADVDFLAAPFSGFDVPLGLGTGAAVIFGVTGGVMEAALRTAVEKLTGEELQKLEFTEVRGMEGIKEASYQVAGKTVKVAAVSGLSNAKTLLDQVKNGQADYQFIEVMACRGGCISGGGQPHQFAKVWAKEDVRSERAGVLYDLDGTSAIRKSHENPGIIELYDKFLESPGSARAHQLLHTTYHAR